MKKFLCFLAIFFITSLASYSADMRFIQVDGAMFNLNNKDAFINLIEKVKNEKDVNFVVFTGNNISSPNKTLLKSFLAEAKKLKKPFYVILGQKDINKQKDLGKKEYTNILSKNVRTHKKIDSPNYVFTQKNIVFIVADGSKEFIPTPIGYYREDTLLWLDEQLSKYKDKTVIILQHYPIVPPAKKETYYTHKADEYLQLLTEHKNVKAVISGHFNANNEQTVNDILHISTKNAPTYRIIDILDYDTDTITIWSTIKE